MAATAAVEAADAADMVAEAVGVEGEEAAVEVAGTVGTVKIFARSKQISTSADRPLTPKGRAPAKTKADTSSLSSHPMA
jgi:hypothetical protein